VVGRKIFIIGGCCGAEQRFNDVHILDTGMWHFVLFRMTSMKRPWSGKDLK